MRIDSPKQHRFTAPGGEICWFEWGQPSPERPTLLLAHATGFHARCWDRVVAALPQDWHVAAIDFPGHGRSYKPENLRDWRVAGDDLRAFVSAQFKAPVQGIGHSMGGYCLAHAAAHATGLFSAIMLIDPVILPPETYANPPYTADMPAAHHPVSRRRSQWESAAQMAAHFATRPPYAHWERAVLDNYCDYGLLKAESGSGLELACPPLLEASIYLGSTLNDPYPWLGQIECPVTVLRAPPAERLNSMDFSASPTWPGLAAELRQGTDILWDDCTHFIPMEQPERLAALITGMAES